VKQIQENKMTARLRLQGEFAEYWTAVLECRRNSLQAWVGAEEGRDMFVHLQQC
jgi:hypothetical protein